MDLTELAATHQHELVALRRMLHSEPELSGAEHVTTETLVERLIVEGLQPHVLSTGTGLVCDIPLNEDDPSDATGVPLVVLRADIDALAMDDRIEAPYRSHHSGIAHACGHDVHTAALLGAALVLLAVRRAAPRSGVVRLVFEPAEEVVPGGAVDVIGDGWLQGATSIFGLHCDPKIDVGLLGLKAGALTAAADMFEITLTGPGGHTARPGVTVDLVRWAGRVADRLSEAVQRRAPSEITLVFGAVHAGAAANVIPATAVLRGSFRSPEREAWLLGEQLVREALADVLTPDGTDAPDWGLAYTRGVPPVINDPTMIAVARAVATELFGPECITSTAQSRGGDSFAWYTERIPGTYVRLGTHQPGAPHRDLHSATFDVDESAIGIGAALLAGCALAAVASEDRTKA